MELHGVTGKPYKHPEVRRTVPTFTRASISIGDGIKRAWRDVGVAAVREGDTVAGFGSVVEVGEFVIQEQVWQDGDRENGNEDVLVERPAWRVRLHNRAGESREYRGEQRVFAFVPDTRG